MSNKNYLKNSGIVIITFLVLALLFSGCSQKTQHFSFAFYNVENLFDTIDDPNISDESHLPNSRIPWTTERYQTKLDNLSKVMAAVDSTGFPTLFGLCEVENVDVVIDLVNHPDLAAAKYSIIHKDSPDGRGIDVALLYQPNSYLPVTTNYLNIHFPFDPERKTRDILYSKGVIGGRDTLHVFVNHWTSRWGGREETEPKRRFIGALLKKVTDSILVAQPDAKIIIAGDLNDNPDDHSIQQDLGALPVKEPLAESSLYNLSYNRYKQGEGSLYYKSWDMFDQIIVSGNMLRKKSKVTLPDRDQTVIKHEWMLYQPKEGPARPNRTSAKNYYGGYSDHLPVFMKFEVN